VRAAVVSTFVRHPSRIAALLRERRGNAFAPLPGDAPAAPLYRGTDPPRFGEERHAHDRATRAWQPRLRVLSAAGTPGAFVDARAWLAASGLGASFGAASVVMLRRALAAEGIACSEETELVHDVRRYLPATARVAGNFVVGVPAAGGDDLASFGASVRRTIDVGRPVASLAAAALRETLRPSRPLAETTVSLRPLAHIVLSNLGVPAPLRDLPWLDDGRVRQTGWAINDVRPDRISLVVATLDGGMRLGVGFHENVFAADAVGRALARVTDDPVALLDAPGGVVAAAPVADDVTREDLVP
jgi:hypothetical protein